MVLAARRHREPLAQRRRPDHVRDGLARLQAVLATSNRS